MKFPYALIALAMLAVPALADAQTPECRIVVLHAVKDDIGTRWLAGRTLPVDIARDDTAGRSFCAHGGSCLPRMAGGREAVRLTNCRVGKALGGGDFALAPDPRTMGAADAARTTLRNRTQDRLSRMGFSNASAGSFADDYANRPGSPNARLVARALAGSKPAIAAMRAKLP